jgi:hypothetical protein
MWRSREIAGLVVAASLTVAALMPEPLEACGPSFPNQLLLDAGRAALRAPVADLGHELAVIARRHGIDEPGRSFAFVDAQHDPARRTAEVEAAEIKSLMEADGNGAVAQLLEELATMRQAVAQAPSTARVPAGLPPDVALYLEGAIAFARGNVSLARGHWERLLELPAPARRHRSVWAAYMLGKSWLMTDPAMAVLWLSRSRELAAAGNEDALGLALASYGWEAAALGRLGRDRERLERYVVQAAKGDPGGAASVAQLMRAWGPGRRLLVTDPLARECYTAYLLSRADVGHVKTSPHVAQVGTWLALLEGAGVRDVAGADRLAWLAYRYGDVASARRWLARADKAGVVALWVTAKLALRSGSVDRAARLLRKVVAGFPENESWQPTPEAWTMAPEIGRFSPSAKARAELGLIQLSRGSFVDAADALLRAGYFLDGAYVAERVLTIDELVKLVDERWPALPAPDAERSPKTLAIRTTTQRLRELLARRLLRTGRHDLARGYFAAPRVEPFERLVRSQQAMADGARPNAERAAAGWEAAQTVRRHGMELLGTEVGPDWHYAEGAFTLADPASVRSAPAKRRLLGASVRERRRLAKHEAEPNQRFHYRYRAADMAWEAAVLLPDDDHQTATVLCTAGKWLANDDPKAADRFYKALVRRNRALAMAQDADLRRWFPTDCVSP